LLTRLRLKAVREFQQQLQEERLLLPQAMGQNQEKLALVVLVAAVHVALAERPKAAPDSR